MAVLCQGLADARCCLRVLRLAGNVNLGDLGATGTLSVKFVGMAIASVRLISVVFDLMATGEQSKPQRCPPTVHCALLLQTRVAHGTPRPQVAPKPDISRRKVMYGGTGQDYRRGRETSKRSVMCSIKLVAVCGSVKPPHNRVPGTAHSAGQRPSEKRAWCSSRRV